MKSHLQTDPSTPEKIGPYLLRGTIGEGAFSIVKLAYHEKECRYYACKIIPKSRLLRNDLEKRFEIEIRVNQLMHHHGIVQLIDILKDKFNYYVLMEFCPNGELFQYIVDRTKLSEDESKKLIYEIFDTINYIHNKNVAHRDLKPENILLDEFGRLKISDFGLSQFINLKNNLVSTPCGSPCYASPECLSGKPYNGKTNDVWSCGVILYAMVTGQLPWTKRNQNELFDQIRHGEYTVPDFISDDCKNLIKGLMCVDIKKRLTISNAMNHPWFKKGTPVNLRSNINENMSFKFVSLRHVDEFFSHDSEIELKNTDGNKLNNSYYPMGYNKYKYLRKGLPAIRLMRKSDEIKEKIRRNPFEISKRIGPQMPQNAFIKSDTSKQSIPRLRGYNSKSSLATQFAKTDRIKPIPNLEADEQISNPVSYRNQTTNVIGIHSNTSLSRISDRKAAKLPQRTIVKATKNPSVITSKKLYLTMPKKV